MKAFRIVAGSEGPPVVYLYGIVGEIYDGADAKAIRTALDDIDADEFQFRINSVGGDYYDGIAIYNALKDHPATVHVHVDGLAASAASIVTMGGDTITVHEGAEIMVHNAKVFNFSNARELRTWADRLDVIDSTQASIIAERSGASIEHVKSWIDAETYFTAAEAVEAGLATSLGDPMRVAACCMPDGFQLKRTPKAWTTKPVEVQPAISAEQMLVRAKLARAGR